MQIQGSVLYVELDEDSLDGLSQLIELEGFRVFRAASFDVAKEILEENKIHLILTGLIILPDDRHRGVNFVNDPAYSSIAKVVTLFDLDDQLARQLKGNDSVIGFSYMVDKDRLYKLMMTLKSYFYSIL